MRSCAIHRLHQFVRYASTMSRSLPSRPEPLVVVLGSTGTGKSDVSFAGFRKTCFLFIQACKLTASFLQLAVEIAVRFDGEVINADAMQMYRGLPVTTNKISVDEQRGVPHHLLGTIGLDEPTWNVDRFRKAASQIITEIRSRGRLPIVVGGSQYYTDGLLFDDHLVEDIDKRPRDDNGRGTGDAERDISDENTYDDIPKCFPILNDPTDKILAVLRSVDPAMAARWHPNDRRRIQRSLEIFLTTGRRASDIYAEQQRRKEKRDSAASSVAESLPAQSWPYLLLWVYARPDVLNARLDSRVDTMLERGLEQEASEMYGTKQEFIERGVTVDCTKGIWQSIGYKEMEPYMTAQREANVVGPEKPNADTAALVKLREDGLAGIRFGTHRYARSQLRWIKYKTIPYLNEVQALDRLFLLDGTDRTRWQHDVAEIGARLTAAFLGRDGAGELPRPMDVSETAREVLTTSIAASHAKHSGSGAHAGQTAYRQACDVCRTTHLSEADWDKHLRGARHRRAVQKHKRRAMVPVAGKNEIKGQHNAPGTGDSLPQGSVEQGEGTQPCT